MTDDFIEVRSSGSGRNKKHTNTTESSAPRAKNAPKSATDAAPSVFLPPKTVKTNNYHQLKADLSTIAGEEFQVIGLGFKLHVKQEAAHKVLLTYLKAARVEFFTHDRRSEQPFKAVLRELPEMANEEIMEALKALQLEPYGVFRLHQ